MIRIALFIFFLCGSLPALGQMSNGDDNSKCPSGILPIDSNGWTVWPAPTTGKTFYVSDALGSASYDGTQPQHTTGIHGPFLTLQQGVARLNNDSGKDDHLLLRKGDTFLEQQFGTNGNGITASGANCQNPLVIGSYVESQPAVVDPYGNVAISAMAYSAGIVTVTTATNHGFISGNRPTINLTITQSLPAAYNGDVVATVTGANTFTFPMTSDPGGKATTVGVVTRRRPLIEVSTFACGPNAAVIGKADFIAVVGLECYGYKSDINSPAFDKKSLAAPTAFSNGGAQITWRMYEDNKVSYVNSVLIFSPGDTGLVSGGYYFRRNVIDHNFSYGGGIYISGARRVVGYQNIFSYNGWYPALNVPVSVTATTGAPPSTGVFTWKNNWLNSDDKIQFTTTKSLPGGISAGVTYFAENVGTDSFTVSTTPGNMSPVTITSAGSGVLVYWLMHQPTFINAHSFYLQNGRPRGHTVGVDITQNISSFQGAPGVCECGSAGRQYENLFFQANIIAGVGKHGQNPNSHGAQLSWNGFFEISPFYTTPTFDAAYAGPPAFWFSPFADETGGPAVIDHNLLAFEVPAANGRAKGFLTQDSAAYQPVQSVLYDSNVICGINQPVQNAEGAPLSFSNLVDGFGYASNTATNYWPGTTGWGIYLTGGHGRLASGLIYVDGSKGQVRKFTANYQSNGENYEVGDILSSDNTLMGGVGSGWSLTVDSLNAQHGIRTWHISSGGSGYVPPTQQFARGGAGSGINMLYAVVGGAVVYAQDYPGYGAGYSVNDTISLTAGGGSGASVTIASVLHAGTWTNNTLQVANCNNLQNANSVVNRIQSVAPPLMPMVTPPEDPIGAYFHSLPYGYAMPVPTVLNTSPFPQTSMWEQGYIDALSHQQKGNWDENLSAHSLLNWARPQFGMNNPP